jgi:arabinan endo-1,5-alpha-L-arabinosidase
VFAGRSRGPFVDRLGVPLTASRVGGTPVISMNGNRWVGPGHNAVITDAAGQDWFAYHAIDQGDPYFSAPNPLNINKRPLLLDRLDWIRGWPTVRAGRWASDTPQPAPVTAAGGAPRPRLTPRPDDRPGRLLRGPTDEFERRRMEPGWSWLRQLAATRSWASPILRSRSPAGCRLPGAAARDLLGLGAEKPGELPLETQPRVLLDDAPADCIG